MLLIRLFNAASKNCEKFTKNLFLRGSRLFTAVNVDDLE